MRRLPFAGDLSRMAHFMVGGGRLYSSARAKEMLAGLGCFAVLSMLEAGSWEEVGRRLGKAMEDLFPGTTPAELQRQLSAWLGAGVPHV